MANGKTTGKTSAKAKLNVPQTSVKKGGTGNKKTYKKAANSAKRQVKNLGAKGVLICLLCLIIGAALSVGAYFIISKNDCFEIVGKDEMTLSLDEAYTEQGVKIIEFGKDLSTDAVIETDMKLDENGYSSELGTFYVKYTVNSFKYGKLFKIQKIRLVSFVEASEGGE